MAGRSNFDVNIDLDKFLNGKIARRNTHLPDLAGAVERGVKSGTDDFSVKLLAKLIENIAFYGLTDSLLINQIKMDVTEDGILLRLSGADAENYAMFVEYGTGVVGEKGVEHPWAIKTGWEYNTKDGGWWYPSSSRDNNSTRYKDEHGDYWAFTLGQEARPFMYETWMWARQSFSNTINTHIKRELAEVERMFK